MTKKEIALKYLDYLQQGDIHKVVELFSVDGIVDSPIYGIKRADEFYLQLNNDTKRSELNLKGIFEQQDSNNLALYFGYKWTLKNNAKVEFDVVDIIEFDSENKIKTLKIIYDTVASRDKVEAL
ncbi:nuclear transport factor 2 family protein [Winogradskyella ouciana]|uniref:Nuclear transport factor 2 family protein n=1 Tax=Winogradskyella ouciana TaxID=2608631 RepID=A0A7K1G9P8_9FLAO|nr:nuclear transport factor 2 family protein [Winogradskyella ouciana]MTE26010.1 nuclear transport factor 2 family protein [Winogradskyella ouciana]